MVEFVTVSFPSFVLMLTHATNKEACGITALGAGHVHSKGDVV